MNNSSIKVDLAIEDSNPEVTPRLQAEEARFIRIIEALQGIQGSKEWSTLKTELFDSRVNVLEKDLKTEARKIDSDPRKLNRIAGELEWAEKYANLHKLEEQYRVQLQNVRKQLHGKESD